MFSSNLYITRHEVVVYMDTVRNASSTSELDYAVFSFNKLLLLSSRALQNLRYSIMLLTLE
jgi:hypothetical protein